MTEKLAEWAVNFIANHPSVVPVLLALGLIFLLATLTNHAIKTTWAYAEMPRWARFILGFTMPIALNFYHFGGKIGIEAPDVQTLTAQTVRSAVAADDAAKAAAEKP